MTAAKSKANTAANTAKDATAAAEEAMAAGKESFEKIVQASTDAAASGLEKAMAFSKENGEKASAMAFKGYEEMSTMGRETFDTVMHSGNVLVKGIEEVGNEFMRYAQSSMDSNVAWTRQLFSCSTLQEAIDIQANNVKSAFDTAVAEGNKLSELTSRVMTQAFEPLGSRFNANVERMSRPIA